MAERDQFAEDYRTCPSGSRLAALSGVQVRVGAMEQLIVEWEQPNPDAWGLQGDTAVITVVTDAPRQLKRNTALDTTRAVFNDMDYFNHVWTFKVAVTEGETVISEVVTRTYPYRDDRSGIRASARESQEEGDEANRERASRDTTPVPRTPVSDRSVRFGAPTYSVMEGDSVPVTVRIGTDPGGPVTVPLDIDSRGGATPDDYTVRPTSVTFNRGERSRTIMVEAMGDNEDDSGESVLLSFDTLPATLHAATPRTATVKIMDQEVASFGASAYSVTEGSSVPIEVRLSADPGRTVTIPLTTTNQGGASASDYSGVPASVTFNSGETSKTFTLQATGSDGSDSGESVLLGFGTLPTGVGAGTPNTTTVSIAEQQGPTSQTVSFGTATYSVTEGDSVQVEVQLSSDPGRTVTIPLTTTHQGGASAGDYSGVPASVTFNSGETGKTFAFQATGNDAADSGESVLLGFGTLPANITAGTPNTATVSITDQQTARFGAATYTVTEGDSIQVEVRLSGDPGRTVAIPLTTTNQGGASAGDYSGVPASVTFNSGETSKTFTVQATASDGFDRGESVLLGFGTLPTGIAAGTPNTTTVNIADQEVVGFGAATYSVTEGASVQVTVQLGSNPGRTVVIPLTTTNLGGASAGDYSGVPASVTFNSGETSKTFTVQAAASDGADSGESVRLGFGTLPAGIAVGTTNTTTISIADSSVQAARFLASSYTVAEEASVRVAVQLSQDPGRTVTIPLTTTNLGGATAADYSGIPTGVTFNSGQTVQTFTFEAVGSDGSDTGESVRVGFGTLPAGIAAGTPNTTTINITDRTFTETTGNIYPRITYIPESAPPQFALRFKVAPPLVILFNNNTTQYILSEANHQVIFEARWTPTDPSEGNQPVHTFELHRYRHTTTTMPACVTAKPTDLILDEASFTINIPTQMLTTPADSDGGTWDVYATVTWGTVAAGHCSSSPDVPNIALTFDSIEKYVDRHTPSN